MGVYVFQKCLWWMRLGSFAITVADVLGKKVVAAYKFVVCKPYMG